MIFKKQSYRWKTPEKLSSKRLTIMILLYHQIWQTYLKMNQIIIPSLITWIIVIIFLVKVRKTKNWISRRIAINIQCYNHKIKVCMVKLQENRVNRYHRNKNQLMCPYKNKFLITLELMCNHKNMHQKLIMLKIIM